MSVRGMASAYARQLPPRYKQLQHPSPNVRFRRRSQFLAVGSTQATSVGQAVGQTASRVTTGAASLASDLSYYIPTEIVALYAAATSVLPQLPTTAACSSVVKWWPLQVAATTDAVARPLEWAVIAGAIMSPIVIYFAAMLDARQKKAKWNPWGGPWFSMLASVVAFLAWANYLPNSVLPHCFSELPNEPVYFLIAAHGGIYIAALILDALGIIDVPLPSISASFAVRAGLGTGGRGVGGVTSDENELTGTPPPIETVTGDISGVIQQPFIVPLFLGAGWQPDNPKARECYDFINAYIASSNWTLLGSSYQIGAATIAPFDNTLFYAAFAPVPPQPCTSDDVAGVVDAALPGVAVPAGAQVVAVCFLPDKLPCMNMVDFRETGVSIAGFHGESPPPAQTPYALIPYIFSWDAETLAGREADDFMMSTIAHELCEMVTDPAVVQGPGNNGYQSADGYEIADMCVASMKPFKVANTTYNIQKMYIQDAQNCV